jgi:D-alanyl-D-alanine carboxypeptidase (penicillin-binding protein 5/6)
MRRGWDGRAAAAALLAVLALALPALIPGRASALAPPHLGVTGAILVSPDTQQELYGVNPTRQLAIASTTKLMTALVTLQHRTTTRRRPIPRSDSYPASG